MWRKHWAVYVKPSSKWKLLIMLLKMLQAFKQNLINWMRRARVCVRFKVCMCEITPWVRRGQACSSAVGRHQTMAASWLQWLSWSHVCDSVSPPPSFGASVSVIHHLFLQLVHYVKLYNEKLHFNCKKGVHSVMCAWYCNVTAVRI